MTQAFNGFYIFFSLLMITACGGGDSSNKRVEPTGEQNSSVNVLSNHLPVAEEQTFEMDEDANISIYLSAKDDDNDTLIFTLSSLPTHGNLRGEIPNLRYEPHANYYGEDEFKYYVDDGKATSKETPVKITINAVNDVPKALAQAISTYRGSAKAITLSGEDTDDDNISYALSSLPQHGEINGTVPYLTYLSDANYTGEDHFSFYVSDGKGFSKSAEVNITVMPVPQKEVTISGQITYDFIPPKANGIGLDYDHPMSKSVRYVSVKLLDANNEVLDSTVSDENGNYQFTAISSNLDVKIRVYAKMLQTHQTSWNVKVVDNTQTFALYALEGVLTSSGVQDSIRNLHASSGWDGVAYSEARAAAPFAIMDTIYQSMQTVLRVDENLSFPALKVNWSPENKPALGSVSNGEIISSHYDNGNLYLLGDADSDTDEYDRYVIAHEWGHYYEEMFSRTDSLGGTHEEGQFLDIRVAFSEGFGNAIAGIIHDDPHYYDTYGTSQSMGWQMDMEKGNSTNAGWYSEGSVQRILYDLYDDNSTDENLSLGFSPLHHVLTGAYKNTPAFTSLFSFITPLKTENNGSREAIDRIVAQEGIAPIEDIYGENRTLLAEAYPYHDLIVGMPLNNVCTTNRYGDLGSRNKLSNHQYIKFTLEQAGDYRIHVQRTNGIGSDPDFTLFKTVPFHQIGYAESPFDDVEEIIKSGLEEGEYLLDLSDWNTADDACFDINITAIE